MTAFRGGSTAEDKAHMVGMNLQLSSLSNHEEIMYVMIVVCYDYGMYEFH